MSDIKVPGFKASEILTQLNETFNGLSASERAAKIKKTAAIFELCIKNGDKEAVWTLDLKDTGTVYVGPVKAPAKPGVTLTMSDDTFEQLASGKMDGQKAFMTGKLKSKGNLMLATKLAGILGTTDKAKAKL